MHKSTHHKGMVNGNIVHLLWNFFFYIFHHIFVHFEEQNKLTQSNGNHFVFCLPIFKIFYYMHFKLR